MHTPEGDAAHIDNLHASLTALTQGRPPPPVLAAAPLAPAPPPVSIGRIGADFGGEPLLGGGTYQIDARALGVDPDRFQFKSGGDARGVTGSLDISQWNDEQAGKLLVWQDNDGKLWVANGHQRTGKALELMNAGHDPIMLTAQVVREADGVSADEAMLRGAIINIGENATTPLLDAAKVARLAPGRLEGRVSARVMRTVGGLARLSDDAWGMVKNGTIPPEQGSLIGQLAPDPTLHAPLVALLHETKPASTGQAAFIIRDALSAGATTEEQMSLFGSDPKVTLLVKRRAQIQSAALAQLREDKRFTATAMKGEARLSALGNTLDRGANAAATTATDQLLTLIDRLSTMKGSFVSEALRDAAEQATAEGKNGNATRIFVERLRAHPDLVGDALRGGADAGGDGGAGGYSPGEFGGAGGEGSAVGGAAGVVDATSPDYTNGAAGTDALSHFDDPAGDGAQQQVESLEHDAKAAQEAIEAAPGKGVAAGGESGRSAWLKTADEIATARKAFEESGGEVGPHGPVHPELSGHFAEAIKTLLRDQDGDVPSVVVRPDIGPIDLIYGNSRFGLAHIAEKHPEVLEQLPDLIANLPVLQRPEEVGNNRWILGDGRYRAVIAPDYYGDPKRWIVTAYDREAPGGQTSRRDPLTPDGGSTGAGRTVDIVDPAAAAKDHPSPADDGRAGDNGRDGSPDLGLTADVTDPNIAAKEAQRLQLAADSPIRATVAQADLADTSLFGQSDMFATDAGTGSLGDLLGGIADDDAALAAMKGCL